MSVVAPLHTAAIDGHSVRFFGEPHGRVEVPWVAIADLHAALGQPADDLPRIVEAFELIPDGASKVTVSTATGPALILSSMAAFSFLNGAMHVGRVQLRQAVTYGVALGEAVDRLLADLPAEQRDAQKAKWLADDYGLETAASADPDTFA